MPYRDVKEQFGALDLFARRRLYCIQSIIGLLDSGGSDYVWPGTGTFRHMGLRTFRDVANRYKPLRAPVL